MNFVDYMSGDKAGSADVALLTLSGSHSYSDLLSAADAIAGNLLDSGASKGDRVLLLAENSFFWVACYLGTLRAGCVSVPLDPGAATYD